MRDELALLDPDVLARLERLAGTLSKSSLMPDALRGKPADILITLMTGAELGLQPMQALRSIAVVKGKPSLSADLMVSLVKQRKDVCEYLILVKSTPEVATYEAKRVGDPKPTELSFTMEDAKRAGLTGSGGMYSKYPAQMLRARCASGICRAVFPDLCMGLYDSDSGELTEGRVEKELPPAPEKEVNPAPTPTTRTQKLVQELKAKIVDVKAGETEDEASSAPVLLFPLPNKGQRLDSLPYEELVFALSWGEMQIQHKPNAKNAPKVREHISELKAEMERRGEMDPDTGEVPFSDEEQALILGQEGAGT